MEIAISIGVVGLYFALNGLLASKASDIAQQKGYEKSTWFHMCFWLGVAAYIVVSAMPDKRLHTLLERLINTNQTNNTSAGDYFDDLPKL